MLVTNERGRPLEFHCTEPVRANRAQQILYGETLAEYLCGELIAPALAQNLRHAPQLLLTDIAATLAARPQLDFPVIFDRDGDVTAETARPEHGRVTFACR